MNNFWTEQRSDSYHVGANCCLLLPVLADSNSGPAQPSVWTSSKERYHLVHVLPLVLVYQPSVPLLLQKRT
ncbi:hypothetical protein J4Q44_G00307620 [Coregonus suidteri]|uniref:Uncharacterized protein n=1 Tax=Coregonus suidteri TaxID=861788 RepID=A0AAN8KUU7_9TELE